MKMSCVMLEVGAIYCELGHTISLQYCAYDIIVHLLLVFPARWYHFLVFFIYIDRKIKRSNHEGTLSLVLWTNFTVTGTHT